MTPDLIYDQMIGMGCASRLVFSWGGNPGVGSLHRFRDAIENHWPAPLAIEEHSHADMAARYQAGASGLPFAVLRGYLGSDIPKYNASIGTVTCPFTGELLTATRALESRRCHHSCAKGRPQRQCLDRRNYRDSERGCPGVERGDRDSRRDRSQTGRTYECVCATRLGGHICLRSSRWGLSLLCARLLPPGQCILQGMGPDLSRSRHVSGMDEGARIGDRRFCRVQRKLEARNGGGPCLNGLTPPTRS